MVVNCEIKIIFKFNNKKEADSFNIEQHTKTHNEFFTVFLNEMFLQNNSVRKIDNIVEVYGHIRNWPTNNFFDLFDKFVEKIGVDVILKFASKWNDEGCSIEYKDGVKFVLLHPKDISTIYDCSDNDLLNLWYKSI